MKRDVSRFRDVWPDDLIDASHGNGNLNRYAYLELYIGEALDADVTSRSQALVDRYRRGELTRDDYLDHLRRDYHSIHAGVRSEAIRLLNHFPEPERTRELIQLAVECQWRETQPLLSCQSRYTSWTESS